MYNKRGRTETDHRPLEGTNYDNAIKDSTKVLFLKKGRIEDLTDIVRIAHQVGKKVLNCDRIKISPIVYPYPHGYIVTVSPDHNGKSVESGKNEDSDQT